MSEWISGLATKALLFHHPCVFPKSSARISAVPASRQLATRKWHFHFDFNFHQLRSDIDRGRGKEWERERESKKEKGWGDLNVGNEGGGGWWEVQGFLRVSVAVKTIACDHAWNFRVLFWSNTGIRIQIKPQNLYERPIGRNFRQVSFRKHCTQ